MMKFHLSYSSFWFHVRRQVWVMLIILERRSVLGRPGVGPVPSRGLPISWDLEASIWPRATSQPGAGQLAGQPAGRLGSWPGSLARPAGPARPRKPAQSDRPARATKTPPEKAGRKICEKNLLVRILANLSLHFFPPDFSPGFFPGFFPGLPRFFPRIFPPDFSPGFFPRIFPPDFSPDFSPDFFPRFFLICLGFFPRSHQVLDRGGFPSFLKARSSDGNFLGAWGKRLRFIQRMEVRSPTSTRLHIEFVKIS